MSDGVSSSSTITGPVFDIDRLIGRYQGDMQTVLELCQVLRDDLPGKVARLTAAAQASDTATIAAVAHSVKGICGTMASDPCRFIAQDLEMAAKDGDIEAVKPLLQKLLACLDMLLAELPG